MDSRIKKVKRKFILLIAYAGVKRLGIYCYKNIINPKIIVPALGQGAIALVVNKKNEFINKLIGKLNHEKLSLKPIARVFLEALDGDCKTPVGGYAVLKN